MRPYEASYPHRTGAAHWATDRDQRGPGLGHGRAPNARCRAPRRTLVLSGRVAPDQLPRASSPHPATTSSGASYKWLDLAVLCRRLLPGDTINRIRYFTAQIQVRGDPWKAQRQQTYLWALQTIPNLTRLRRALSLESA